MPLISIATDAFGVLTITTVFLTTLLGIVCIFRSLYFQFWIRRKHHPKLSYFNGPWVIRIFLILLYMYWGFGEISRLRLLKSSLFSSQSWQKDICKIYILSNLGFVEPSMFIMLSVLLQAALQKREFGTLSRRWNRKTLGYVLFFCFPVLFMQAVIVLVGPRFRSEETNDKRVNVVKYFTCVYSPKNGDSICANPLLSTVVLGSFYALLISYITYVSSRLLAFVINKGLRRRIYVLVTSVIILLPLRILLLGLSVLPPPGNLLYDAILFLAFLILSFCITIGICTLVYLPVADSLALRNVGHIAIELMPYDDYYYDGASLIANQSLQGVNSNYDESAKPSIIPYSSMNLIGFPVQKTLVKPDFLVKTRFSRDPIIVSSSVLSPSPGRPLLPP